MHHHRLVELRGDVSFVGRAEVSAPFKIVFERTFGVGVLQHLDGLVVGDARERGLDLFQLRNIAADSLQVGTALFEAALDDEADEVLGEFHDVVEFAVRDLGFDHPEFGEVTAGLGLFRAKRGSERIDLAQCHSGCFDIELAGLSEESLFLEVIDGE